MSKRLDQLTQLTAAQVATNDIVGIRDQSAGQTKYITVKDLTGAPDFSWQATGEAWSYSSYNSTTKIGVVTVPTDATIKYNADMWVRFTQTTGGTKYGRILSVTATALTVYFGANYILNNETITSPVYSSLAVPVGVLTGAFEIVFIGYSTLGQSITGGFANITLQINNAHLNIGGTLDLSTYTFTASVKGLYEFDSSVHYAGSPGRSLTHFSLNGTLAQRFGELTSGGEQVIGGKAQYYLASGDYMTIVTACQTTTGLATSGGVVGKGGGEVTFGGRLIKIMP